jgi:hypothetical protein
VIDGVAANFGPGVGDGAELVLLVLEEIGVDGAGFDFVFLLERLDGGDVGVAVGEVPRAWRAMVGVAR